MLHQIFSCQLNGAPFTIADDSITLQWASVGSLQENEAYRVTIEDLTAALGPSLVDQVADTKYIVPSTVRPTDGVAHIFSWFVEVVRISGSDESGNPIWTTAGAASSPRYFSWIGAPAIGYPNTINKTKTAVEISTAVIFISN